MLRPTRRAFLKAAAGGAAAAIAPRLLGRPARAADEPEKRPNILWLSAEDISPTLGCYGDAYARSPNLDKFAEEGVRYENAFTHAPVCAPARSGIITGMYPTTIGTTWMRCRGMPPAEVRCFPEYLRAAGYYCTNNSKTDYQFSPPPTAWDASNRKAHWRKRPRKNQPFFAVFNFTITHESKTRVWKKGRQTHDPAKAPLPPYYPDTPVVRQNIACYYDRVSQLDGQIADRLKELEDAGLADDTIVFFWGDHGWGLTRGKRWVYDSGIRVPLMVRVPEKWRQWAGAGEAGSVAPGRVETAFARFLDFAPTVLSLAGVEIPDSLQGRAFLGPQKGKEPPYLYAARDRMDETIDCIRALRDKRFKYIRNFMPWLSRAQHINYMDRTPILKEMRRLHAAGKLHDGPQMQFFQPRKPACELYDITRDPHEVRNLAGDPKYRQTVERMEAALVAKMKAIGDVGLIPECDFDRMKTNDGTKTPWRKRIDESGMIERILALKAYDGRWTEGEKAYLEALADPAGPVRYWAVYGLREAYPDGPAPREVLEKVRALLTDEAPSVPIAAAHALVDWGETEAGLARLVEALKAPGEKTRLLAGHVLEQLGPKAKPAADEIEQAANGQGGYPGRLLPRVVKALKEG